MLAETPGGRARACVCGAWAGGPRSARWVRSSIQPLDLVKVEQLVLLNPEVELRIAHDSAFARRRRGGLNRSVRVGPGSAFRDAGTLGEAAVDVPEEAVEDVGIPVPGLGIGRVHRGEAGCSRNSPGGNARRLCSGRVQVASSGPPSLRSYVNKLFAVRLDRSAHSAAGQGRLAGAPCRRCIARVLGTCLEQQFSPVVRPQYNRAKPVSDQDHGQARRDEQQGAPSRQPATARA